MKRDLELTRRLLLEIESRGPDCSVGVLRIGANHESIANHETEERNRYHLRLLIDAGLLKEVDRTTAGVPCVRLTHDGHEFLELSRSENLWREALAVCRQRTGGFSLSVVRTQLLSFATEELRPLPRERRRYLVRRPLRESNGNPFEPIRYIQRPAGGELVDADRVRYVRVDPASTDYDNRSVRYGIDEEADGQYDWQYDSTYPTSLI